MSDMAENMKQVKSTENIVAVNKPTLQQAIKQYKKSPFSLFLRVIVTLAAFITVAVLLFLVAYIVVMGVPNLRPSLFELKFTSENASLLPAAMCFAFFVHRIFTALLQKKGCKVTALSCVLRCFGFSRSRTNR